MCSSLLFYLPQPISLFSEELAFFFTEKTGAFRCKASQVNCLVSCNLIPYLLLLDGEGSSPVLFKVLLLHLWPEPQPSPCLLQPHLQPPLVPQGLSLKHYSVISLTIDFA